MNPKVIKQAQPRSKKLPPQEWERLLDSNRIMQELMQVAGYKSPTSAVMERLLSIDAGIAGGIDYLVEQTGKFGAGGRGEGMWQMIRYVMSKDENWRPPQYPFATVTHDDQRSFYWIYFQKHS